MGQQFSQGEIYRIFSYIPPRTLISLATSGVIEWVDEIQDGRGTHRIYSLANLYQIAVATQLSIVGFAYNRTKYLVMDNFLKGCNKDEKPKILNYMDKMLGIKIGEETFRGRRKPLISILFSPPEKINEFVIELSKPFLKPDIIKQLSKETQSFFFSSKDQVQPITILIINLPELALKVKAAI